MSITTPQLGSYRTQSTDFNSLNRNPSATASRTVNSATTSAATKTATVDLAPVAGPKSAFDSDTVANNILSFVQRRLTQAAQQGASTDQLATLLAQARKGAAAGFDQAVAELKGNGSLDDSLNSGISSALQKVDKGFDALAKQFGIATDTDTDTDTAAAPSAAPKPAPALQANSLTDLAASYRASFSSRQSVDLIVKTADGDIVHLQLGVKDKQSVSASYQANASGQQLTISASEKSSARLSISVDGNLDAGELQALSDLLGKVGDLADKFFGGDVAGAFQQASALDFSNPELSSLSLDLRSEVRIKEQVGAYQQIQGLGNGIGSNSISGNNGAAAASATTLSDLADALTSLLPQASTAANPAGLLKQILAAQIGATNAGATDQQTNPLLDFANRLLTALGADKSGTDTASAIDAATVGANNKLISGTAPAAT